MLLCKRLDLFGRELLAVDGTRIKAVNNKDRNFTRGSLEKFIKAADERFDDYLARLDDGDVAEAGTCGARTRPAVRFGEASRKANALAAGSSVGRDRDQPSVTCPARSPFLMNRINPDSPNVVAEKHAPCVNRAVAR
jgi:hypothetical protein